MFIKSSFIHSDVYLFLWDGNGRGFHSFISFYCTNVKCSLRSCSLITLYSLFLLLLESERAALLKGRVCENLQYFLFYTYWSILLGNVFVWQGNTDFSEGLPKGNIDEKRLWAFGYWASTRLSNVAPKVCWRESMR